MRLESRFRIAPNWRKLEKCQWRYNFPNDVIVNFFWRCFIWGHMINDNENDAEYEKQII